MRSDLLLACISGPLLAVFLLKGKARRLLAAVFGGMLIAFFAGAISGFLAELVRYDAMAAVLYISPAVEEGLKLILFLLFLFVCQLEDAALPDVAVGIGVGVNSLLSKSLGEKNQEAANRAAGNGIVLMAIAMVLFVLFPMPEVQEHKTEGKVSPKEIMACPAFLPLVLIIGLYFIAEHGIMNWLVSYATNALEVPMGQAANFTAVFFGCVMVGRLVLSSLVDKLGIYRCLRLFATSAAVLYTAGVLLGAPGLWLLAVSGLLFSILYPTLVMLIPRYWPSHAASSASGLVLSVASLADILFNAVFGSLVDAIGYRTSFLIMPACMVGCTALLWLFFAKAKKLERCD